MMKNHVVLLLFLMALVQCLTGCITRHTGGEFDTSQLKVGVTTRRDVVARWGNPDRVREDEWTWISGDLLGGKVKCAYMLIGFTIANTGMSSREIRLKFDKSERLSSVLNVQSMPNGVEWRLLPW